MTTGLTPWANYLAQYEPSYLPNGVTNLAATTNFEAEKILYCPQFLQDGACPQGTGTGNQRLAWAYGMPRITVAGSVPWPFFRLVTEPSKIGLLIDAYKASNTAASHVYPHGGQTSWGAAATSHSNSTNITLADGHAVTVNLNELKSTYKFPRYDSCTYSEDTFSHVFIYKNKSGTEIILP